MISKKDRISLLKLLSDPSRYEIIKLLMNNDGTLCVNEVAKNITITPSAVSHQLTRLENEDIVKPVRKGQNVCYKMTNNKLSNTVKGIITLLES